MSFKKGLSLYLLLLSVSLLSLPLAVAAPDQSQALPNPFQPTTSINTTSLNTASPGIRPTMQLLAPATPRQYLSQYKLSYLPVVEAKEALQQLCPNSKLAVESLSNTIFLLGSVEDEASIKKVLATIDRPTSQITLAAKVISLNNEASKALGVSWKWEPIPQYNSNDSSSTTTSGNFKFYRANSLRFGATLNALIAKGKAKIIASPHIITLPGKQGRIFIGDHIPYQVEKHDSSGNYSTTEYIDAGISLKYTPILDSSEKMITASVETEVSTPSLVSELKNYKVTSRKIATTVRMHSEETLAIGGLITEEEQRILQKVPFFGDIPLLGNLFKNRTHATNKTEILLLLTPQVSPAGKSPAIYNTRAVAMEELSLRNKAISPKS